MLSEEHLRQGSLCSPQTSPGKAWLPANLQSHSESEQELHGVGKGPQDGEMLNKNTMN